jgi:hypothetical protein
LKNDLQEEPSFVRISLPAQAYASLPLSGRIKTIADREISKCEPTAFQLVRLLSVSSLPPNDSVNAVTSHHRHQENGTLDS